AVDRLEVDRGSGPRGDGTRDEISVDRVRLEGAPDALRLDFSVHGLQVQVPVEVLDDHVAVDRLERRRDPGRDRDVETRVDPAVVAARGKAAAGQALAVEPPAAFGPHRRDRELVAFAQLKETHLAEDLLRALLRRGDDDDLRD